MNRRGNDIMLSLQLSTSTILPVRSDKNPNDSPEQEDVPSPSDHETKDDVEIQLEKLLFGDDEGFRSALKSHAAPSRSSRARTELQENGEEGGEEEGEENENEKTEDEELDLEGVDDRDLFFFDSGALGTSRSISPEDPPPSNSTKRHHGQGQDEGEDEAEWAPVWHDSDDDRLVVSLAGHGRLRKLRRSETEDIVSGREYILRLRRQYLRLHPTPEWALPQKQMRRRSSGGSDSTDPMDTDSDEDAADEQLSSQPLAKILQNIGDLIRSENHHMGQNGDKAKRLRQEIIGMQRLKDVGETQPSAINSLCFHPHHSLLLSSGPAATLFLHHISPDAPRANPLVTSMHIRRTPFHTSAFAPPTGNRIVTAGRRRFFHVWDLDTGRVAKVNAPAGRKEEQKSMERFRLSPCGRYIGLVGTARKGGGLINVLDATTAQWVAQVRVDGRGGVVDFAWWRNGEGMTVASRNGEVSEWDGQLRRVVARWVDEGAVGTTVLSLGGSIGASGRRALGGDRWVAVGSSSGIVNLYDRRAWSAPEAVPRNPSPTRMLDQLTTPITSLVFSPDCQLLVMASQLKRDALRLIHLPSCTVYRNWPTSSTPLGRISAVAISPLSNYLAVGNEQGRLRLWEIHG